MQRYRMAPSFDAGHESKRTTGVLAKLDILLIETGSGAFGQLGFAGYIRSTSVVYPCRTWDRHLRSRTSKGLALSIFGSCLGSFYGCIQIVLQNLENAWLMFNVVVIQLFTASLMDVNEEQKIWEPQTPTFVHLSRR
jgi:hypothetical protein